MKVSKGVLILLLLSGMFFCAAQSAFGGCEVAILDQLINLQDQQNAPGTKYYGTITIYFEPAPISGSETPNSNMYYFLRLRKGYNLYSFAGKTVNIDPRASNLERQVNAIGSFFNETVIPKLYDCTTYEDCPVAFLKSYSLDVSQEESFGSSEFLFYIADIVIAVQD